MPQRPCLLLLPGLLNDQRVFAPQVAALAPVADIVVGDVTQHDSIAALADAALTRVAAERFALVGFSMGGYVAFELLRRVPHRIERLALLDTQAEADTPEETRQRQAASRLAETGRFKGVTSRLLPQLIHARHLADEAITGPIMAMAEDIGRDGYLRQQRAIMARPDSRPLLAAIAVPTLVLCGENDTRTPPERSVAMAEAIPGAELVLAPECGHVAPLEQPDDVNQALARWLQQ
jgi:pimeloyl-ACP methyl ester carboxylesterase